MGLHERILEPSDPAYKLFYDPKGNFRLHEYIVDYGRPFRVCSIVTVYIENHDP